MKSSFIYLIIVIIAFCTGYILSPSLSSKNIYMKQTNVDNGIADRLDFQAILATKNQQISILMQQLEENKITGKSLNKGLSLSTRTEESGLTSSLVMSLADKLYYDDLIDLLSSLSPFNREEIASFSSPSLFAARLLKIGAGNAYEEQYQGNEYLYQPIFISSESKDQDSETSENDDYFVPSEQDKVYANFSLPGGFHDSTVFVKWYNTTTKKTLLFKKMTVNPSERNHNIWLRRSNGWESGIYNVEIYSANENMNLIGASQFEVLPSE